MLYPVCHQLGTASRWLWACSLHFPGEGKPSFSMAGRHYRSISHLLIKCLLICSLLVVGDCGVLFAITDASKCAEQLPYGNYGAISTADTARFCGDCCPGPTDTWLQEVTCGGVLRFTIRYNFASGSKTLLDRFTTARTSGEATTFTVDTAGGASYSYSGKFWYTDRALRWTGANSGTYGFSTDDGLWMAGTGDVNGDSYARPGSAWGHGNLNSADSYTCATLYENGVATTCSGLKSFVYCVPPPAPPPPPPPQWLLGVTSLYGPHSPYQHGILKDVMADCVADPACEYIVDHGCDAQIFQAVGGTLGSSVGKPYGVIRRSDGSIEDSNGHVGYTDTQPWRYRTLAQLTGSATYPASGWDTITEGTTHCTLKKPIGIA